MKFGTLQQMVNQIAVSWPKIEFFIIQGGGGRHLENCFCGHNSSTIFRFRRNFVWRSRMPSRQRRIGSHSSPPNPCSVGVPQGSVLGPLLFSLCTSPISTIANSHQVSQQQYADDTQLYVAILPANYSQYISALESCLNSLRIWFCENGMALNPTKSVAILFGTPKRLKSFFRSEIL